MNILKVFTIVNNQVYPGAKVKSKLSKSSNNIPIICVGSKLWENGFKCLPVTLSAKQQERWERKKQAHIFYARLMRCHKLSSLDYFPNSCQQALIIFRGDIGQGGSNSYRGDLKENMKTYNSFPGRILKKGKIGHLFLAKIYTGSQIIAIVSKDQIFSFIKRGQMQERNKEEYFFYFDGHEIHSHTKSERINYSLFPESRF